MAVQTNGHARVPQIKEANGTIDPDKMNGHISRSSKPAPPRRSFARWAFSNAARCVLPPPRTKILS